MTNGNMTTYRQPRRRRGRRRPEPYRVGEFILAYMVAVIVVLASLVLAGPLCVLAYLVVGFFLSRFVTRRVVWFAFTNNIANAYHTKTQFLLKWPIIMPRFIWQIAVVKAL